MYIHPPKDTLLILESILDSVSATHSLEELYSKNSLSPDKVYLVKCEELGTWSRALIKNIMFTDQKVSNRIHQFLIVLVFFKYIFF